MKKHSGRKTFLRNYVAFIKLIELNTKRQWKNNNNKRFFEK
jgi:hypothetical protein